MIVDVRQKVLSANAIAVHPLFVCPKNVETLLWGEGARQGCDKITKYYS